MHLVEKRRSKGQQQVYLDINYNSTCTTTLSVARTQTCVDPVLQNLVSVRCIFHSMSSNTAAEHSTISYNNFLTIISEKSTELYIYCNCVYKMRKSSSVARRTKDIYTWMYCLPETMFWWGQVDCSSEFFYVLNVLLPYHLFLHCMSTQGVL
jgi:hypothetical protein